MTVSAIGSQAAANPLLQPSKAPHGLVQFDKITPADYEEAVREGIRQHQADIDAIVNNPEAPTFANTVKALDRAGSLLTRAELALSNVEHATGDTALMSVKTRLSPILTEHSNNVILNEPLFQRIKVVYDSRNADTSLSPEDIRLIEITYRNFAENGSELTGEARETYRRLSTELSDKRLQYAQNVSNGMNTPEKRMWFTLDELEGIPADIIEAARLEAAAQLKADGKEDDGSLYLFTVYAPSYSPFMKYAKRRDLREKMYKMYNSRNLGGQYDNTLLLKDIANIRLEMARLFGKQNFAEYQLQQTMAATPENVLTFLNGLKDAYKPAMQKEIAELEAYAQQTEGADFRLQAWDYSYWADKLKNERYAFNDEDMKPYFELNKTIDGVFGLAKRLYGFTFKQNKKIPVYHPDVRAYEVYGPDNKLLGILYADFFYRPGKAPGAWMTEFMPEYRDDNGKRQIPEISIVCNFSKPVGDKAVLLTPYEVETFLHEFGHALHGLSAQSSYATLAGTNVFHDFVELFSQFNENFLPQKEFLDTFAAHYQTGEKMPQSLIDKFTKSQQFGAAYACMRQLNFGLLDMAYHTRTSPLRATDDLAAFEAQALEPVQIFPAPEGTLISPSFAHIFSGGYAAGYYGYKWAERLDADAFAAFLENGIFDPDTAARFKHMMETGGSVDPMTLYIEFRGKEPGIDALLKRDGIK